MALFDSIVNAILPDAPDERSVSLDDPSALALFGANPDDSAGVEVTMNSVVGVTAVYAAVRIIAEGIASLPTHPSREVDGGRRERLDRTPAWMRLPNTGLQITMQDLVSMILVSLLLRGNAYVLVMRNGTTPESLEVLNPDEVHARRVGGRMVYSYGGADYGDLAHALPGQTAIQHVRGLTLPGEDLGVDPITAAAAALGISIAAQRYGAGFMENASLPPGYLSVPGTLSPEGAAAMKKAWENAHRGAAKAGRIGVLTEGTELKQLSLTPEQTQFIEVRRFGIQDVARIFGIPPHLLADSSNSTSWGSGLAEQNTAFSRMTLTPWASRVENALTTILRSERFPSRDLYVDIRLEGFERGSYSDRINTYIVGLNSGLYTVNEVRGWEGLEPLPEPEPEPEAESGADPTEPNTDEGPTDEESSNE